MLVVDARHPIKAEEAEIVRWCEAADLPVLVLLNKTDKLKQAERARAMKAAAALSTDRGSAEALLFSATERHGVDDAMTVIAAWFAAAVDGGTASGS